LQLRVAQKLSSVQRT